MVQMLTITIKFHSKYENFDGMIHLSQISERFIILCVLLKRYFIIAILVATHDWRS